MPPTPPYAAQHAQQPYPALYLYPLNDSFVPKHISLVAGQRVKIGRQTNPKTAPGEKNGFFDSKVLSRQHAEIWEDGGKIYIKDVKSSNGTFINGERLSPEGVESEPYELKSDDIVEFGIDIVGEDNKTIIHHKVAARAVCVFSEQDAHVAARAEQHQQQQQQQQHLLQQQQQHQQYAQHSLMGAGQPGPNGIPSQFNFVGGPQQRRPGPNVGQGLAGIGGMGGSMRPPGKSGLTFEHILNRLQGELQKSRETGSELHSLSGSMHEIHEVLGGNITSSVPPYPSSLPPARPVRQPSPSQPHESHPAPSNTSPPPDQPQPQQPPSQPEQPPPSSSSPTTVISQLQSQLHDAQISLSEHANKVRALEEGLADHELIRKEVRDLRQLFESRSREILFEPEHEMGQEEQQNGLLEPRGGFDHDDDDDIQHIRMLDEVDEEDDAHSISTIIPHELEPVDEEDEEQVAAAEREDQVDETGYGGGRADPIDPEREREDDADRQRERERQIESAAQEALRKQEDLNVGRPRTPEPSFGLRERDQEDVGKETATKPTVAVAVNSPRTRSGTLLAPHNRSPSSPLSQPSTTATATMAVNGPTNDEVLEQVLQLSAQIAAMVKLTSNMEAQYAAAQDTIKALENKVTNLERIAKENQESPRSKAVVGVSTEDVAFVLASTSVEEQSQPEHAVESKTKDEEEKKSLTEFFAEWKKTVEGQWSDVKEEWREERERLKRAREEWEAKMKSMDSGLDKMNQLHTTTSTLVKDIGVQKQELSRMQERVQSQFQQVVVGLKVGNGDALRHGTGHGSGLVTPPSPRSQSSDSGGGRRRRKRRSGSGSRGRSGRRGKRESGDEAGDESDSDDATLASEGGGPIDAVKVTAFANGIALKDSSSPPSTTIGSHAIASTTTVSYPTSSTGDETAASRAYYISLLDVRKEQVFDYEDDAGSSLASEEEVEEWKKVPGPKDPTAAAKAKAAKAKAANVQALATPSSLTASFVSEPIGEQESDVGQKKTSSRPNAVNFQTAGAVVVLAVAAAAVFWKVRSE